MESQPALDRKKRKSDSQLGRYHLPGYSRISIYILRQKENQTFHSGKCHLVAIYEFPETRQPLPRSSRCSFIPLIHQPAYFIPLQGLKLYRKREGFKLYVPYFDSYVLVLLPNT